MTIPYAQEDRVVSLLYYFLFLFAVIRYTVDKLGNNLSGDRCVFVCLGLCKVKGPIFFYP